MNFKKIKNLIKFLSNTFLPTILKIKLIRFFNLDVNKFRLNVGIRSEDYFQAFKKESNINKPDYKYKYYLHKAFNKHLVRSNLIDDQWWSDFVIMSSLSNGLKFREMNQSLIDRIEVSNFNSLEYYELLDIYALCLRLCFFELGYKIRLKSLKKVLSFTVSKKIENWKVKVKLSALLEIGEFLEFDNLFPLLKFNKEKETLTLNFLRQIYKKNKNETISNLIYEIDDKKDKKFRKFIENKKIAIIGPAPVQSKDGEKIDRADIVLRTNYKIGDSIFKGTKCDINYFNLETANDIYRNGCLEWPKKTSWIVGKASIYMEKILKRLFSDGIDIKNLNVRTLKRVDSALFNGSLSLIQNIIVDLARYNPKEIFLYHFDIMLSKERIPGYYTDVSNNKELHSKMIKCFPGHDPVTQFLILKSFWKLGFIKGDKRFEEVISMDVESYMRNMQKNYLN